MTISQYNTAVSEVSNYPDIDSYLSDMALSSIWGDPEGSPIPEQRIHDLSQIWDVANRSMKEIALAAGMSQRKLAERFCIPYRTMEDWCRGVRTCPVYIRLMMQECLRLFNPTDTE